MGRGQITPGLEGTDQVFRLHVSFSVLAVLTFEAEGFFVVGTVLYLLDPLANHASLPPLAPKVPGKEPLVGDPIYVCRGWLWLL